MIDPKRVLISMITVLAVLGGLILLACFLIER
jgi:hypothetical protein